MEEKRFRINFTRSGHVVSQQLYRGTREGCEELALRFFQVMGCLYYIEEIPNLRIRPQRRNY